MRLLRLVRVLRCDSRQVENGNDGKLWIKKLSRVWNDEW